jgi:phosphoserine phosphatase RsbU/P
MATGPPNGSVESRRLLVIDDDEVDRMALRRALSVLAVVDEATDAASALTAVQSARYDLVILDYFLPPDTGPAVLLRLRELQPGLPAVFVSGSGNEDVAVEAMKAGGEDYLAKSEDQRRLRRVVRAALESSRLRQESERSRARLALAVEAAQLGTWSYEPGTRVFRGDARFATLLGLVAEDAWPLEVVLAALEGEAGAQLTSALAVGEVNAQVGLQRSGWVDLRGRQDATAPPSVFGTALDISAQKEAELRSTSLREKLMGVASHDLKNPLSAVKQASALLARSPHLDEKERRFVAHIRSSAERMTSLIVQLLDLTRVRLGGGLPLSKARTSLRALVVDVVEELRLAHPERTVLLDLTDAQAEVDPDRFAQLVSNLAGNALKHSPPGSTVRLELKLSDDGVTLTVHNVGTPIPPREQALIFEPFVQLGAAATRDGLGLGLYISKEILQAHGGTLSVESSEAGGTRFTARFPAGDGREAERPPPG